MAVADRQLPDGTMTLRLHGAVHSVVATLPPPHSNPNCRCVATFDEFAPYTNIREDACELQREITTREIDACRDRRTTRR